MSGRPAAIRQRDLKQAIMGARKAGVREIKFQLGSGVLLVIPTTDGGGSCEPPPDSNNSFDKIMRTK